MAADSIGLCEPRKLTAAGYLEDGPSFVAIRNNKGLEGYQQFTQLDYSVTVRTADGSGSGYAVADYTDVSKFNAKTLTSIAATKAAGSVAAKAIEPGKYTVILEPAALVSDESILNRMTMPWGPAKPTRAAVSLAKRAAATSSAKRCSTRASPSTPIRSTPWLPAAFSTTRGYP